MRATVYASESRTEVTLQVMPSADKLGRSQIASRRLQNRSEPRIQPQVGAEARYMS